MMIGSKRATNNIKDYVVFYCKDCEKIVDTRPVGRKFAYRCVVCNTKNVAFGTEKTIRDYYRVEDDEAQKKEEVEAGTEEKEPAKK